MTMTTKTKKIVKSLSGNDLIDWEKNHPWKEERDNAKQELKRRARKNK